MLESLHPFVLPALAALLAVAGCTTAPPNLDLSLDKDTAKGMYHVTLVPPADTVAINKLHTWQVQVRTPDGKPVTEASVAVDGGMPQHLHGLPTKPRVSRELSPGTYLVEGMKFSMPGWWEVKLDVSATPGADKVTFNTVLDDSGARK